VPAVDDLLSTTQRLGIRRPLQPAAAPVTGDRYPQVGGPFPAALVDGRCHACSSSELYAIAAPADFAQRVGDSVYVSPIPPEQEHHPHGLRIG
jgi:hypothetical protein